MARSVYDVAVALGIMTGVDPADPATKKSEGSFETDYTKYLKADALKGARIGIARDFLGHDADVDWVVEASLDGDEEGRRDHRRRPLSEVAARREGRVLQHHPAIRSSPRRSPTIWRRSGPAIRRHSTEMIERANRCQRRARRRRRAQSRRGGRCFKREAGQRQAGRLSLHGRSAITGCRWCAR